MEILGEVIFSEKDLDGLEELQCVLAFVYNDEKLMVSAYESILRNLVQSGNLYMAQNKLDLVINIIKSLGDFLPSVEEDVFAAIKEVYVEILDETVQSLKQNNLPTLKHGNSEVYSMNPLLNARFTEKDLERLGEFRELLVKAYHSQEAVEAVYNAKLYSLSRSENVAAAQRRLNFEISCLYSFILTLQNVHEKEETNSFFDKVDEFEECFEYELNTHQWRDRLLSELRC